STSRTRRPISASVAPRLIVVVVFPTPPFWLHTAATRAGPCVVNGSGSGKTGRGRPVGPILGRTAGDAATLCCTSRRMSQKYLRWNPDSRACLSRHQADSPCGGRQDHPPAQPRARGCAEAYTSRSLSTVTSVYTWVVVTDAWPSSSCTTRTSA